jgi:hypothetical protein
MMKGAAGLISRYFPVCVAVCFWERARGKAKDTSYRASCSPEASRFPENWPWPPTTTSSPRLCPHAQLNYYRAMAGVFANVSALPSYDSSTMAAALAYRWEGHGWGGAGERLLTRREAPSGKIFTPSDCGGTSLGLAAALQRCVRRAT